MHPESDTEPQVSLAADSKERWRRVPSYRQRTASQAACYTLGSSWSGVFPPQHLRRASAASEQDACGQQQSGRDSSETEGQAKDMSRLLGKAGSHWGWKHLAPLIEDRGQELSRSCLAE